MQIKRIIIFIVALNVFVASAENLKIGPNVLTIISDATKERLRRAYKLMIDASKHRVGSQKFEQPKADENGNLPFKIVDIQDPKKQLLAVERVERELERKRKEIISERERKAQLGEEGNEGGDDDKPAKKKKKKDQGPGVSAKYMSDDVRNKTTNETALMIAGGVMKSWMLTGSDAGKDKLQPSPLSRQNSSSIGLKQDKPIASPFTSGQSISPVSAINTVSNMPTNSPISNTPLVTSPANATFGDTSEITTPAADDQQPRGRGRPKRRKSGSGNDFNPGKKQKLPNSDGREPNSFFLPPSNIGNYNRMGAPVIRQVNIRDVVFVLENEGGKARRTLLKTYTKLTKPEKP
jgi:hypothetical protein